MMASAHKRARILQSIEEAQERQYTRLIRMRRRGIPLRPYEKEQIERLGTIIRRRRTGMNLDIFPVREDL